jgi:hypothetical protein
VEFQFPDELLRSIQSLAPIITNIRDSFSKAFLPHIETMMRVAEYDRQTKRLKEAGWLPHYTTPADILANSVPAQELCQQIDDYYSQNWTSVSSKLRKKVNGYAINSDSKRVFIQALKAHKTGLYSLG